MKNKKFNSKKQSYSALEKKAYYTGFGVGLADAPGQGLVERAYWQMSDKERESYWNGFFFGKDNMCVRAGTRDSKTWFVTKNSKKSK